MVHGSSDKQVHDCFSPPPVLGHFNPIITINSNRGTVHISAKARLTSVAIQIRIHIRTTDPDRHQNLIICSMAHCQSSLKITCKCVWKFLHKAANRQTDRQLRKHILLGRGNKWKTKARLSCVLQHPAWKWTRPVPTAARPTQGTRRTQRTLAMLNCWNCCWRAEAWAGDSSPDADVRREGDGGDGECANQCGEPAAGLSCDGACGDESPVAAARGDDDASCSDRCPTAYRTCAGAYCSDPASVTNDDIAALDGCTELSDAAGEWAVVTTAPVIEPYCVRPYAARSAAHHSSNKTFQSTDCTGADNQTLNSF